jgi:periplasmic divalent cation tolerance protein
VIQISTTLPNEQAARDLGRHLVEQRLAACAQVLGPIHSTYWWHGAVTADQEWLLVLKTGRAFEAVAAAICAQHPYAVPEILATPVTASREYAEWVETCSSPS